MVFWLISLGHIFANFIFISFHKDLISQILRKKIYDNMAKQATSLFLQESKVMKKRNDKKRTKIN